MCQNEPLNLKTNIEYICKTLKTKYIEIVVWKLRICLLSKNNFQGNQKHLDVLLFSGGHRKMKPETNEIEFAEV